MPKTLWLVVFLLLLNSSTQASGQGRQIDAASRIVINAPLTRVFVSGADVATVNISGDQLDKLNIQRTTDTLTVTVSDAPARELKFTVPLSTDLEIRGKLADIFVSNINGEVLIRSEHNPIEVRSIKGSVDARNFLAPVVIHDVDGAVIAESNRADITLSGISGRIQARTATASISLMNSTSDQFNLQALHGEVRYEGLAGPQCDIVMGTHSGEINAMFDKQSNASLSFHGESDKFSVSGLELEIIDRESARATAGSGSGQVVLESLSGPVNVTMADREIRSLRTTADVSVSDGLTYMSKTVFVDRYHATFQRDYPDRAIHQVVEGNSSWQVVDGIRAEGTGFTKMFVLGHQFHAMLMFPDRYFDGHHLAPEHSESCDCLISERKDRFGNLYELKFDPNSQQMLSSFIRIFEGPEVLLEFQDWRMTGSFLLPHLIKINDGERRFEYRYTEIVVDEEGL